MSAVEARIAAALAEHQPRYGGADSIACSSPECAGVEWEPEHVASVVAALPDIAIVPRKDLEVGGPKLAAIRDLHTRDQDGEWQCHDADCDKCQLGYGHRGPICSYCSNSDPDDENAIIVWPCPTVQIIDGLPAPGLRLTTRAAGGQA